MSAFLAILSWLSVFLLVEGINRKSTPLIGSYLDELIYDRAAERKRKTFLERRVLPKARDLAVRYSFLESFSEPEKIAPLLDYAGRPYDLDTEQFMGYQIYLARIGFICGLVYFILALLTGFLCGGPIALILGPIGCFFYPRWWINREANRRQEKISLTMPDFIDLLVIIVKGGATNLDRAIDQILPQITGPLKDEIHQMRREMELGEERADAYHKLTHRNSSEDLRIFVDAILQGDELGRRLRRRWSYRRPNCASGGSFGPVKRRPKRGRIFRWLPSS